MTPDLIRRTPVAGEHKTGECIGGLPTSGGPSKTFLRPRVGVGHRVQGEGPELKGAGVGEEWGLLWLRLQPCVSLERARVG